MNEGGRKQLALDTLRCSVSQLCRSHSGTLSDHGPHSWASPSPSGWALSENGCPATQAPNLAVTSHSSLPPLPHPIRCQLWWHCGLLLQLLFLFILTTPRPPSPLSKPSLTLTYTAVIVSYLGSLPAGSPPPICSPWGSQSEFPNVHVWSCLSPTQKLKADDHVAWHSRLPATASTFLPRLPSHGSSFILFAQLEWIAFQFLHTS